MARVPCQYSCCCYAAQCSFPALVALWIQDFWRELIESTQLTFQAHHHQLLRPCSPREARIHLLDKTFNIDLWTDRGVSWLSSRNLYQIEEKDLTACRSCPKIANQCCCCPPFTLAKRRKST